MAFVLFLEVLRKQLLLEQEFDKTEKENVTSKRLTQRFERSKVTICKSGTASLSVVRSRRSHSGSWKLRSLGHNHRHGHTWNVEELATGRHNEHCERCALQRTSPSRTPGEKESDRDIRPWPLQRELRRLEQC